MGKLLTFFTILLCANLTVYSQCADEQTFTVCDMTTVDGNSDGDADGIINLYDEYSAITGTTITPADGTWFDPNFNFALNTTTGDLFLWDLPASSEMVDDYQFQFLNSTSGCPNDIEALLNIVLGPYAGTAAPTTGDEVNLQVCQSAPPAECGATTNIDLFQILLANPSPHDNGEWTYMGSSPNFVGIADGRFLNVNIPYQPGPPLVDEETFELEYRVPGITPCALEDVTTVKVSVVKEPFAGFANTFTICETELLAGDFDTDIDLSDDAYLVNENIEGTWVFEEDTTGQLTGPGDSVINLKEIYDNLVATNPQFGCQTYDFTYRVESRSTVCMDQESTISFTFYEFIRPFAQDTTPEFCVDDPTVTTANLYDYLGFANEGGTEFDYPNNNCTNWTFISGPSDLGLVSNTGNLCSTLEDPNYTSQGTIDLSGLTDNTTAGTYIFEYTVNESYHCSALTEVIYDTPDGCSSTTSTVHPCTSQTAQVVIIVNPTNYAGEDTSGLEFCETDSPLVLTDLLETNGIDDPVYVGPDGTWTDLADGSTINNNYVIDEITTGSQDFNFEYTTTTSEGCIDTALLSFTVYQQFDPGADGPLAVCNNGGEVDLFTLLNGTPDPTGTWTGPGGYSTTDNVALFDPATGLEGDYIYTVPANENCPGDSATVNVTIEDSLYAGEDTSDVEICETQGTIDLLTLLETNGVDTIDTSGEWTDELGSVITNPFDIPEIFGDQSFQFTYTTSSSDGCEDSAVLSFVIYEQYEAGEDSTEIICDNDVAINLFDLLGGTPDTNGTWSGPDGYTTTDNNAPFDPSVNAPGDYVYTVPANGACEANSATVLMTISEGDYAGEDTENVEICDDLGEIDLTTLLETNGIDTIVTSGIWTNDDDDDNDVTNPFSIPTITGSQVFNFTYTTTSSDGCVNSATLSFTIFEQSDAGDDATVEICMDGTAINLFDSLGGTPDTTGTWSGPNGYTTTDNNAPFTPMTDAEGEYTYTTPANGACEENTAVITVSFFEGDYAGEDTSVEVCALEPTIDLLSLLETNGIDVINIDGVWTNEDGDEVSGIFSTPDIDGSEDFVFTYTTTSDDGCIDSAVLSLTLFEQISAGESEFLEICREADPINLFDSLGGTPDNSGTWSGPDGYATTDNNAPFDPMTNAEGEYTYTTPANGACGEGIATVTVAFYDSAYAGEDTADVEVCDISGTIDLFTLLDTNGNDTVNTTGIWTDVSTGDTVANPFVIPAIDDSQDFNFIYNTNTADGCADESTLSFTIFESGDAGVGTSFETCVDQAAFNLFDLLTGTPDTTGTWSGPDGYIATGDTAIINPVTNETGEYTYTVPANGACDEVSSSISITLSALSDAGDDINTVICPGDYTLSLFDLLDISINQNGVFTDLDTDAEVEDGLLEVGIIGAGSFSFDYTVSNGSCGPDSATINFTITPVSTPTIVLEQYCVNEGATLGDIDVSGTDDFAWYAFAEAGDPLPLSTLLLDGQVYFLAAVDDNGCESERVQYVADILPLNDGNCGSGITNGVSDNDDGINDFLELGSLPTVYPNFDIQIFNRYGTIVYRGDSNTPLFSGDSNTGSALGDQLPTGVYFYIFYPNAEDAQPIDGNFYLSR